MKYNVVIHYEGAWNFEIEAESAEAAEKIAEWHFDNIPAEKLIDNCGDIYVCDCYEINEGE